MENLNWQIPLWKMKLTGQQFMELKAELKSAFENEDTFGINKVAKEAALYYAEWWRNKYNGGSPSKINLSRDLGIDDRLSDELFELAKRGGKLLGIHIIKKINTLWFRSLLIQGGLPINHITSCVDNFGAYKRFLIGLIKYAKEVSVNWDDLSFIKSLNCTSYLPNSFQNDDIYELSLLIARAIVEDNYDLLPYDWDDDDWSNFTNELKQSANNLTLRVPFIIRWKAHKEDQYVNLYYSLECAKKISSAFVTEKRLTDCYSFNIYINNKYVANYILSNDNIFNIRDSRSVFERWNGDPFVHLHIKTENNKIIELTVPNCYAPDFENPILVSQTGEDNQRWEIRNSTRLDSKDAVVYPEFWFIKGANQKSVEKVEVAKSVLNWHYFSESIEIVNNETGDVCIFDQNESHYNHEVTNWKPDWIQQASYNILLEEPTIHVYGEDNERIPSSRYCVFFREYRVTNWQKFGENALPVGLLEFKIVYPDGKFGKEKFFHTGPLELDYTEMDKQKGVIQWNWKSGEIYSLSNQKGLKINESGEHIWEVERENEDGIHYPEKIGFKFHPKTNSPGLDVYVATPFKGIIIIDENDFEVLANKTISSNALYTYRYIVMGYEKVKTKISHQQNPRVVIKGELGQGIISLSRFDDDIKKLFDLQGSEAFSEDSKVLILIGSGSNCKTIDVRDFNLYTKHAGSIDGIQIVNNRNEMQPVDFNGKLQAVSVNCSAEDIQVVDLKKREDSFVFNPDCRLEKFIVFTDKYNNNGSADLIVPRYFDFAQLVDEVNNGDNSGFSPQELNIRSIKEALETHGSFDEEWKKVHKYFLISVNHHIPFKTFNHLRAVGRTPELLAKMFISMGQSAEMVTALPKEKMINALESFEQELAIGWHWLNADEHWNKAIDWYLCKLPDFLQNDIRLKAYGQIKELLDHSLLNQNQGLINQLLSEDCAPSTLPPSNAQVNEIRAKLGANQNYPENLVFIPDEWTHLFPNAMNTDFPIFVRSFLFSPVKTALAFMGKDFSIWNDENMKVRRVINFYRQLKPNEYLFLFENMVCQIKNKKI